MRSFIQSGDWFEDWGLRIAASDWATCADGCDSGGACLAVRIGSGVFRMGQASGLLSGSR